MILSAASQDAADKLVRDYLAVDSSVMSPTFAPLLEENTTLAVKSAFWEHLEKSIGILTLPCAPGAISPS